MSGDRQQLSGHVLTPQGFIRGTLAIVDGRIAGRLDEPGAQRDRQAVDHAQADAAQQHDGELESGVER